MQNTTSLSVLQQQYHLGRLNKKELEGLIFQYLMDNFEYYHVFDGNQERWIDFLSWLYPRLSRAVDSYREKGSSFDAYINTIVQGSSREYRVREADHYATEYACWRARAEEMALRDPEPEYGDTAAGTLLPPGEFSDRQILILFLKSYYFISDDFLDRVAKFLHMDKEELRALVEKLRILRDKREKMITTLKENIHSQYYRCLTFQKKLLSISPESAYYKKLQYRFERAHVRFLTMQKRLAGIRLDASNRQIAKVLNIPKGTVDSILHTIREKAKLSGLDETGRVSKN
jgi:RNA polymerase sigma factor (sigma-70 family)